LQSLNCNSTRFHVIPFESIWFSMICFDLTWFALTSSDLIWFDLIWFDLISTEVNQEDDWRGEDMKSFCDLNLSKASLV
jgi:hypothetical protein